MTGWNRRQVTTGIGASFMLAGCASAGIPGMSGPTPKLFYLGQAKVFGFDPDGTAATTLVDHSPKDGSRPQGVNDGIAMHARQMQIEPVEIAPDFVGERLAHLAGIVAGEAE